MLSGAEMGTEGTKRQLRREKETTEMLSIQCREVPNAGAFAPLPKGTPAPSASAAPPLSSCRIHGACLIPVWKKT